MFPIGTFHRLPLRQIDAAGGWLDSDAGEILLPAAELPADARPGARLWVFVYRDAAGRLTATLRAPKAQVGEFACLKVVDVGPMGAFLDWGLAKDLLVPFAEQPRPLRVGERTVVRLYLDNSGRIAATARIDRELELPAGALREGEEVALLVYGRSPLGAKVIINGRYEGLLFRNECLGPARVGDRLTAYVRQQRPDGKVDLSLRPGGRDEPAAARERVLQALAEAGGQLPLSDKSPPEQIAAALQLSKKSFKKAIGGLYKEGEIELAEDGIRLRR